MFALAMKTKESYIPINYAIIVYASDNKDGYRYTVCGLYLDVRFDEWYK